MDPDELIAQIPGLRRYARSLTADPWASDDLVQDTLERACSKQHLWVAGTDLRAWIFTIMHNIFLNQVRKSAHGPSPEHAIDAAEVNLQAVSQPIDTAIDLQRCLARLPPEQRAVLLLVTLENLSYEAVAQILAIPTGTVMSRLSRARSQLLSLMNPTDSRSHGQESDAKPALRRMK
jgi:RNA polymerase sigma-70 factor (ECF subfamily)